MAIINNDILMYQKENKSLVFTITNSDGTPKDMTGGSVKFVIIKDGVVKLTKIVGNGILINNNKITVLIEQADTSSMMGKFSYELRLVDIDNKSVVSALGDILIKKSNTI